MGALYDRAEIYDLANSEEKNEIVKKHYQKMFEGRDIRTILDCSIGSGNLTLGLAELGYEVVGSDLSGTMLARCQKKAEQKGLSLSLRQSDFRRLTETFSESFDCVMSTGNSLPHVPNDDLREALRQMDTLIRPGGTLYLDTRNWDQILEKHQRFYSYPPLFNGDTRINLVQLWDYETDGSMTFHLLYTFEQNCHIIQEEQFEERYYPVPRAFLLEALAELGYTDVQTRLFPYVCELPYEKMEWYCLIATKPEAGR